MLQNTFLHIQGIGPKTEKGLWRRGIRCWDDFLRRSGTVFSDARDRYIEEEIRRSADHLEDIRFFAGRLPPGELWRLFGEFRSRAAYLDIETSGGLDGMDEITVIGLYDGNQVFSFVNGRDLDRFEEKVCAYDLLVTFNGSLFDVPFIRRAFPHITLPHAHIDLRFVLKRLGYSGGLKRIEKALGVGRDSDVDGLNGYDAVRMWRAHREGREGALERLLAYNRADIVNLEPLMVLSYERLKREKTGGAEPAPAAPAL
ncbi:conserved hypothetical protein [uncultured Desulfatiglans sp.]|nr:conserved hypothetical protein [uncultured Desulfatiglans sp.]